MIVIVFVKNQIDYHITTVPLKKKTRRFSSITSLGYLYDEISQELILDTFFQSDFRIRTNTSYLMREK